MQLTQREPLTVWPGAPWQFSEGEANDAYEEKTLKLYPETSTSGVIFFVDINADDYTLFELRMRASQGSVCRLSWKSTVSPNDSAQNTATINLLADDAVHTYRVFLSRDNFATWAGVVTQLHLAPSDESAEIEIESIRLHYVPPQAPLVASINNVTHEALFAPHFIWKLVLPENARFKCATGMLPQSWEDNAQGEARFVATLYRQDARPEVMVDHVMKPHRAEMDREWVRFSHDLSAYAGESVSIVLDINGGNFTRDAYACWGAPTVLNYRSPPDATPIIFIVCDTLRADHVSCYGYERETTPYLDAFANEAVLFENAITEVTWTLPAHATMFTGLSPVNHRVTLNANLASTTPVLAQLLSDADYVTGAFTALDIFFFPWRGLARGFDHYDIPGWPGIRDIFTTQELVNAWLDIHAGKNMFLFFHNYDIHNKPSLPGFELPYGPDREEYFYFSRELTRPQLWCERDGVRYFARDFTEELICGPEAITPEVHEYIIALYDDAIRSVDFALSQLFERLKAEGLYDQALIIVTSDHGEDLGDHGKYKHWSVYEECARIPLLVRFPDGKHGGSRYAGQVQLADLLPTVLDVVGIESPSDIDGVSLLRFINGELPPRPYAHIQRQNFQAVRSDEWKLIVAPNEGTRELYNLLHDPKELNNLAETDLTVEYALEDVLNEIFRLPAGGWHFYFKSDDPEGISGEMALFTEGKFNDYRFEKSARNNMFIHTSNDDQRLLVQLKNIEYDELVIPTIPTSGRVTLQIDSDSVLRVRAGNQAPVSAREHYFVLDAAESLYSGPPTKVEDAEITIWFVSPETEQDAARELSPESMEVLEALGYIH